MSSFCPNTNSTWSQVKDEVTHRLRTAVRTWKPPSVLQHPHQADDGHLTLTFPNHVKETL